ncbi:MAG: N-acetyltransferase [Veillonella magna]|nr:N-acetyltransferase [Veillonella magna]
MRIRREESRDYEAIDSVMRAAFMGAEHSDGNEAELVASLRQSEAYIPDLSLVAEKDEQIVGYIMFTKAKVGQSMVLALAPLAVLPKYQRQGVGRALVKKGHAIAAAQGFTHSVVLGSERYYPQFGYVPAHKLGIKAPFVVPDENFMAISFQEDGILQGMMTYDAAFGIE